MNPGDQSFSPQMKTKKRLVLAGLLLIFTVILVWLIRSSDDPLPIAFVYYDPNGTISLDTLSVDGEQRTTLIHSSPTNPLIDALVRRLPIPLGSSLIPVQLADTMRTPIWIGEPPILAYHSREIGTYCERVQRIQPGRSY